MPAVYATALVNVDMIFNRVGVTKAPVIDFSATRNFNLAKVWISYFQPHSYLSGVFAAVLRWHLSNMNVISNRQPVISLFWKLAKYWNGVNWLSNPHSRWLVLWLILKNQEMINWRRRFNISNVGFIPPIWSNFMSPLAASWDETPSFTMMHGISSVTENWGTHRTYQGRCMRLALYCLLLYFDQFYSEFLVSM